MFTKLAIVTFVCIIQTQLPLTLGWEIQDLSNGLYAAVTVSGGYVSMFVVTCRNVVVIEPVSTKHATELLEAIRNVTNKPITHCFISHNHYDHASGGKVFQDLGAKVIAHQRAYEYIKENMGPDQTLPDECWVGSRKDYKIADLTIELHYFGQSHGLGMTVFLFPRDKLIYTADLAVPQSVYFSRMPDYNLEGLMKTIEETTKLDFTRAIATHQQDSLAPGTKQDFVENLQYLKDVREAVDASLANGSNIFEIENTLELPKYISWNLYNEFFSGNVYKFAIDRIIGPHPWRPQGRKTARSWKYYGRRQTKQRDKRSVHRPENSRKEESSRQKHPKFNRQ